ncbi:MAG: hypothetical protein GWO10_08540, partial [candidate division Zixibacteria bacterium]|nr:hypothetical protein [Phycisphaerae bacterium]NIP50760.1 hypothetical protein [Phycisphaerae bacterium]NIR63803.1 hypothetical protein [candidate division Zixibacteria bacterium]NIW44703.1 hypothetical protein [Gammaproteobacteria bacterium]NIX26546.1 hypothetical protein [Phycisphaerae bacterium]
MVNSPPTETTTSSTGLFEKLLRELANVFDAHGVCYAVTYEIAKYCQTTTLVGISDPLQRHYDVWICDPDGNMKQTRWHGEQSSFSHLMDLGKAEYLDKYGMSASELVKSELWQLPKDGILGVPFPFPTTNSQNTLPGAICLIDPGEDCPLNLDNLEPLATQVTIILDRA